jgi:hypothetical protein
MLMVVFGAGASFDSCPTYPPGTRVPTAHPLNKFHRPPLANELFANRPSFAKAIDDFPECRPIVPRLRNLGERSIEAVLEDIQQEAETYPRAKQELAAVRCYLHRVITETETEWLRVIRQVTNYLTLIREIERTHKADEPVGLVTFNYDTLLEYACFHFGLHVEGIPDYTRHPFYKVFKLHGSVNWSRRVEPQIVSPSGTDPLTALQNMVQRAAELRITDDYIFSSGRTTGVVQGKLAFPAIAIPVEKKSSFECPQQMIDELTALLPQVSKMLVIGWRATEAHFLDLLKRHLRRGVRLHIVAAAKGKAEETQVRLHKALLNNRPSSSIDRDGFTNFMLDRRVEQFLEA